MHSTQLARIAFRGEVIGSAGSWSEFIFHLSEIRPDYAPLIEFALTTGLRFTACQRLTWADVDMAQKVARVRMKSKKPGGRLLELPLPEAAMELVREQRGMHPIYVFTYVCKKSRGRRKVGERYPFSKNGWRKDWAKALSIADIEDFRFHDLRHTAASRVQRAVGNLRVTQQMLGHASIQSTVRYAHVRSDEVRRAMEEAFPHNNPHKAARGNVK
jgi:integrase